MTVYGYSIIVLQYVTGKGSPRCSPSAVRVRRGLQFFGSVSCRTLEAVPE